MKKISPYLILLAGVLLCSCNDNTFTPEFLTDNTIRMEIGKKRIFTYVSANCQYAYNTERHEFRAHTDNMSDYFMVKLDKTPTTQGEEVNATYIEWIERNGTDRIRKNVTLKAVQLEGDNIWLWSSKENIKLSILLP